MLTKRPKRLAVMLSDPGFAAEVAQHAPDLIASRAWQRWQLASAASGWPGLQARQRVDHDADRARDDVVTSVAVAECVGRHVDRERRLHVAR